VITVEQAIEELRRNFDAPPGALDRCEEILSVQHLSLAKSPPIDRLPDAVRLAASARMRANEAVMPRERVPVESRRVVELARALARTLIDDPGPLDTHAAEWVEAALPPATVSDARGVHEAATRLGLPEDVATSIFRESMKPEMLRTSSAFRALAHEQGPRTRCHLCHELPCAATDRGEACCSWCGLVFPWDDRTCGTCGKSAWRTQAVGVVARHARLLACGDCGESMKVFRTVGDPLVLSLHGILISPFDLASRASSGVLPRDLFPVF
jgi:hypothetical protein